MLDLTRLKSLRSGVVGSRIEYARTLDSTMDEARRLAHEGAAEGLVVLAEEQTAGRGRFDRRWVSTPGLDLTFSVILRPGSAQLRMVNMAATMAVQDAAIALTGRPAVIKWPNDVLMSGRKLSGILVESVATPSGTPGGGLDFAIVGVGLNVNLRPADHPEIRDIATSLAEQAGGEVEREAALLAVLQGLDRLYRDIRIGVSLSARWAERVDTVGRDVDVRWGDDVVSGRATGVDEDGNLLVRTAEGITTVVAGEVTLQAGGR